MHRSSIYWFTTLALILGVPASGLSADIDEFKVKRQEVYEFTEKPTVTRDGDKVTITFASKGFCDATVAVEDATGKIIRHLASGVLGAKVPEPFQKDSLSQTLVWDGKNDQGVHVDNKDSLTVRVSLGLKPQFERTFFWSPKKRIAPGNRPIVCPRPEGVYVFEGGGVDHIRLFDHEGNYVRTIWPPPSDKLAKVDGLKWAEFPQDGQRLPLWNGLVQATLLTSGNNTGDNTLAKYGCAASTMAIHDGQMALVMRSLNRLTPDGTTGGMKLEGAKVFRDVTAGGSGGSQEAYPRSAVFSPDGKTLYMSGYGWSRGYPAGYDWLHCVTRMDFAAAASPELFLGSLKERDAGNDNAHFRCPLGLACDSQGRLYVCDYFNDRIQVFTPEGKHVKTVLAKKPIRIAVHPVSGEMYVFSWMVNQQFARDPEEKVEAVYTHLGPMDNPKVLASAPLPMFGYAAKMNSSRSAGAQHDAFIDPYADKPVIWLVPGTAATDEHLMQLRMTDYGSWASASLKLLVEKDGKLEVKRDFGEEVAKAIFRASPPAPPSLDRQRLYVDPTTGKLYLAEGDHGVGKSFLDLLEFNPETWKIRTLPLPYTTEEIAFDLDGSIYLRTDTSVARFDTKGWREIPFDYGEERDKPGFDGDGKLIVSGVTLPGTGRPGCFHLGGFGVSPKGTLVVSCYNVKPLTIEISGAFHAKFASGKPYQPANYPGRLRWGEVHVFDKHGKVIVQDAVGGLPMTDGLAIDKDDSIYALVAANRVLDGKEFPLERAETLMKFRTGGKGKILTSKKDIPVPLESKPDRPFDISRAFAGPSWVEGAEWLYGGVGFGGFNSSKGGGGCACWNARFALDLFARSFATELNHGTVAVLDSSGNLILRIGRYGNVDEGRPMILDGGPADPKSVGGDEVALCHASYVASHTDRRLFIADYGNYRLLSVKLDYHRTETVPLGAQGPKLPTP